LGNPRTKSDRPRTCRHCKLLCRHPFQNWWPPTQIKFCRFQIMFLLSNYGYLKAGKWPVLQVGKVKVEQLEPGDIQDQTAMDNKPILDIKGEIDRRIYGWNALYGDTERRFGGLAKFQIRLIFNINWELDWDSLEEDAQNIIKYLSGLEPKMADFTHWQSGWKRDNHTKKL